ncbi:MAG: hypothetical protein AABW51_01925 [Nanoarchaeota archaeon]
MNKLQKTLGAGILALGLAGCVKPIIKEHKDLTGDGIVDIITFSQDFLRSYTCLFIGQEDGSFVTTTKKTSDNGITYFQADDGTAYFLKDGIYQPADKGK